MTSRCWQRPSGFALVLTLIGVAAFVRLGVWQLDRATQKDILLNAFRDAATAPLSDFTTVRDAPPSERYPHVRVRGHFVTARSYLLDEQMHAGRPGVLALNVFMADGSDRPLLVNRGWVAWRHAPDTTPALPPLAQGEIELHGLYAPFPGGGIRIGGNPLPAQNSWPKLTLYLDPGEIAADLGQPLLPRQLLLDPDPGCGFVRAWTPDVMPPERHRAYAWQWFAFAAAAVAMFVILHWRKVEKVQ